MGCKPKEFCWDGNTQVDDIKDCPDKPAFDIEEGSIRFRPMDNYGCNLLCEEDVECNYNVLEANIFLKRKAGFEQITRTLDCMLFEDDVKLFDDNSFIQLEEGRTKKEIFTDVKLKLNQYHNLKLCCNFGSSYPSTPYNADLCQTFEVKPVC